MAELLALSVEFHASERDESLKKLQELVVMNFENVEDGVTIQKRFFNALIEIGRYREMAAFCEEQLRNTVPLAVEYALHRNLGLSYKRLGRIDEALTQYKAALNCSSDNTSVLIPYARLLLEVNNIDEAYSIASKNLQLDPTSAWSYIIIADIEEKKNQRLLAKDHLQMAIQWADSSEKFSINDRLKRLAALEEISLHSQSTAKDQIEPPLSTIK